MSAWDVLDELWYDLTDFERAKLPHDLAEEHDHYAYGTPKKGRRKVTEHNLDQITVIVLTVAALALGYLWGRRER